MSCISASKAAGSLRFGQSYLEIGGGPLGDPEVLPLRFTEAELPNHWCASSCATKPSSAARAGRSRSTASPARNRAPDRRPRRCRSVANGYGPTSRSKNGNMSAALRWPCDLVLRRSPQGSRRVTGVPSLARLRATLNLLTCTVASHVVIGCRMSQTKRFLVPIARTDFRTPLATPRYPAGTVTAIVKAPCRSARRWPGRRSRRRPARSRRRRRSPYLNQPSSSAGRRAPSGPGSSAGRRNSRRRAGTRQPRGMGQRGVMVELVVGLARMPPARRRSVDARHGRVHAGRA